MWKQESSGVITLNSAGSWFTNVMSRSYPTLNAQSVGGTTGTFVGSGTVQYELFLNA